MAAYTSEDARPLELLRRAYGDEITLEGHQNEATVYRLMAEFKLGETHYAVLQSEAQKREDEVDIYRVQSGDAGEFELETIDDDEEWEDVYDVYDEMTFRFDD